MINISPKPTRWKYINNTCYVMLMKNSNIAFKSAEAFDYAPWTIPSERRIRQLSTNHFRSFDSFPEINDRSVFSAIRPYGGTSTSVTFFRQSPYLAKLWAICSNLPYIAKQAGQLRRYRKIIHLPFSNCPPISICSIIGRRLPLLVSWSGPGLASISPSEARWWKSPSEALLR